ncbi:MAG: alpha/beta hydrolase [Acidobacteriota bacterium]|nr:alpha/beta hydrolase [Acidobacteriota bacterium]
MLRSLAGGALFGEAWGQAPARVLALHGWARSHGDFAGVVGPAAEGGVVDTVAPDLPGFGATPPPPGAWGTAEYAEALLALFEGPGGTAGDVRSPAVVLGHSFGGRVAVALAAARPELVGALVLTGVPLVPKPGGRRRPPAGYRAVRTLRRYGLVGEARLETARQRYGSPDYRQAEGVMREVLVRVVGERYEAALSALRCPVELVWADDDAEAPLAVAEAVAGMVPQARLSRCEGAGHLTPRTVPGALRAAVDRALALVPG